MTSPTAMSLNGTEILLVSAATQAAPSLDVRPGMRNLAGMVSVARLFRLHLSLWLGLLVLAAVAALAPISLGWPMRLAAGWDAGVATFLIATFARIFRARSQEAM